MADGTLPSARVSSHVKHAVPRDGAIRCGETPKPRMPRGEVPIKHGSSHKRAREIGCWGRSARVAGPFSARRRRRRRIWDPNPPRAAETACWADRQARARVSPSSWANQIASPKVLHAVLAPVAAGASFWDRRQNLRGTTLGYS